jgi:hypothetical protein
MNSHSHGICFACNFKLHKTDAWECMERYLFGRFKDDRNHLAVKFDPCSMVRPCPIRKCRILGILVGTWTTVGMDETLRLHISKGFNVAITPHASIGWCVYMYDYREY